MFDFFLLVSQLWESIWDVFSQTVFDINGRSVNLSSIILVMLIFAFALTVFWKGAKA